MRLLDGDTPLFVQSPGAAQILVSAYGSSKLTLQVAPAEVGPWVDTDVTFSAVGVKRFGAAAGFWYRMAADDFTGVVAHFAKESG